MAAVVRGVEDRVERYAPGFGERILARHVMGPADLEARDANLVEGDIGAGTYQLHQQLSFCPWVGWGRPETGVGGPVPGLGLGPPGRGSTACGANGPGGALVHDRLPGRPAGR